MPAGLDSWSIANEGSDPGYPIPGLERGRESLYVALLFALVPGGDPLAFEFLMKNSSQTGTRIYDSPTTQCYPWETDGKLLPTWKISNRSRHEMPKTGTSDSDF